MKILNFGSLNYDNVYEVDHFVQPKETASSLAYYRNLGGKGFNQAIALKRAGMDVYQAGKIGIDGDEMRHYLEKEGIFTDYLLQDAALTTGHAIIEVCRGENCILLYGGANQNIQEKDVDEVLQHFTKDDVLVIQNEISSLAYLITKAHEKGMKIAFNTAPMNDKVFSYPLDFIDMFVVNEVEAKALARCESSDYQKILQTLCKVYPQAEIVMTLGKDGAYYATKQQTFYQEAFRVKAVDTTAAGDTFFGYFLASYLRKETAQEALRKASYASSLTVQRKGAACAIPYQNEIK